MKKMKTQNNNKKDNLLMAMLSIWGILLVVLGHSGMAEPQIEPHVVMLKNWIYSFHMPLFFFISGYLFSYTNPNTLNIKTGKFMKKKFLRLLIPYFAIGAISLLLNRKGNILSLDAITSFLYPKELGFLWYVITLFLVFGIITLICKIGINIKNGKYILILSFLCFAIKLSIPYIKFLNLTELLWYIPFFLAGTYIHTRTDNLSKLKNLDTNKYAVWGGILFITSVLSTYFQPTHFPSLYLIYKYIIAFIGIAFSIMLCMLLTRLKYIANKILLLSGYTYSIYLLSKFAQIPIRVIFTNKLESHYSICILAMFISGILVPILICIVTDKIKLLKNSRIFRLIIGY